MEPDLIEPQSSGRPVGVTALGICFISAALVSSLSALSLITSAAMLEPMWKINPNAQENFTQMGVWAPILLVIVCVLCASAALGFFTGKKWGYCLGVGILVVNLLGDIVNSLIVDTPGGWVGIPIVSLLLWYISSEKVKCFLREGLNKSTDHAVTR